CPLPAGIRLPAAAAAGDSGRLGRVRVPGDQRGHHQGNRCHGDNPAQRGQFLPTTPLRIESSSLSSPVAEGQTLDLNCVIASPAQATVTWYKRGGSLPAKHQVGGCGDGCPQGGWLGLTHGPVQAQLAPCKPWWPHGSLIDPMQVQVAPCESRWPHVS
ncbi:PGBM protein, partial [Oceanites oceanicus]|nr:PGBM protein [Oceanites oceanicus]